MFGAISLDKGLGDAPHQRVWLASYHDLSSDHLLGSLGDGHPFGDQWLHLFHDGGVIPAVFGAECCFGI